VSDELIRLPENATVADLVTFAIARGQLSAEGAERLVELRTTWEKREAEKEFVAAKARLEFPPIPRSKKSLNSYYAPFESIQEIITPILKSEGFTLHFSSSPPDAKGLIAITGYLSHRKGHFQEAQIYQPIGAISKGMNSNQAMGSAISYGERYLAQMMLNLRFVGMDDDAQSFSQITEAERMAIDDLIAECNMDPKQITGFLEWAGAKSISEITRDKYWGCIKQLENKRKKLGSPQP